MKPGRGCLLVGSHLGSFEMLGIIGSVEKKLAINVVMHLEQGAQLRNLVFRSGQLLPYNVIALGQPGSMLRVRECLARGEIVAILADRVYGDEPTLSLPFLGRAARFTLSPWRLARITGAPVVTVFGLFLGGRRYEIDFEGFDGPVEALRDVKVTDAAPVCLQAYVDRLERNARRCPYNWFNFYDYWNCPG
jgi:predicted LPLAT superfamily acyltransferase